MSSITKARVNQKEKKEMPTIRLVNPLLTNAQLVSRVNRTKQRVSINENDFPTMANYVSQCHHLHVIHVLPRRNTFLSRLYNYYLVCIRLPVTVFKVTHIH